MPITIDFSSGSLEQGSNMSKPEQHKTFINDLLGNGFIAKTIVEVGEDDAWSNVYFYNSSLSINDISSWDELQEYAIENEVYINVYDHNSKKRNGFWYDEDEVWIDMGAERIEEYENNVSNLHLE